MSAVPGLDSVLFNSEKYCYRGIGDLVVRNPLVQTHTFFLYFLSFLDKSIEN